MQLLIQSQPWLTFFVFLLCAYTGADSFAIIGQECYIDVYRFFLVHMYLLDMNVWKIYILRARIQLSISVPM